MLIPHAMVIVVQVVMINWIIVPSIYLMHEDSESPENNVASCLYHFALMYLA